MADLKAALVEFLAADPAVNALVADRIYPEVAPDFPAGAAGFPRLHLAGIGKRDDQTLLLSTDQPAVMVQVDCYGHGGSGYADAQALAAAVRNARGPNAAGSRLKELNAAWMGLANRVWVKSARLDDEASAAAQKAVGGGKKWIHQVAIVFSIVFNEVLYQ